MKKPTPAHGHACHDAPRPDDGHTERRRYSPSRFVPSSAAARRQAGSAIRKGVALSMLAIAGSAQAAAEPDKGDVAWMMVATLLVTMMVVPGLALFYGGLVRSKNMLSVLMQVLFVFALLVVLWAVYGYTLAFGGAGAVIGGFDKFLLNGVSVQSVAATFSKGVVIPEFNFVAFQGAFAGIAAALIVGAVAERVKFSAIVVFCVIWFTFCYLPIAHMVWYWDGPDAITDAASLEKVSAAAGWLWQKGALDFAGGTVIHINAGVAGLVGAYWVGRRIGYGRELLAPHSLALTMVGASLLWIGWFGFNAGSALEANAGAALAFVNTLIATAAAVLAWTMTEWFAKGRPSMLGAASGAVAGLVAITPACGFVGPKGAIVIGLVSGMVCVWGVNGLKRMLRADDTLDVFGIHGVGGIVGALLTGVFAAPSLGGTGVVDYVTNAINPDYSILAQVWAQMQAVLVTIAWSAVVSVLGFLCVDRLIGLRVSEEEERQGLDISSHGESAYHG